MFGTLVMFAVAAAFLILLVIHFLCFDEIEPAFLFMLFSFLGKSQRGAHYKG